MALVKIQTPTGSQQWLTEVERREADIDDASRNDMQALAFEIGQGPWPWMDCSSEDEGWEKLSARWNAIAVC
jgi:hypothetical protein